MPTKIFRTLLFGVCCFLLGYAAASYIKPGDVMEQFGTYALRIGFFKGLKLQDEIAPASRQVLTLQIERESGSPAEDVLENTSENVTEITAENVIENTAEKAAENISENPAESTSENTLERSESTAKNTSENTPEYTAKSVTESTSEIAPVQHPSQTEKALSNSTNSATVPEGDVRSKQQSLDLSSALPHRFVKLALVIDDMGYAYNLAEKILRINLPVTWSIIPNARQSRKIADLAVDHGQPFLLHVPMQAIADKEGSSQYVIGVDTSEDKIADYLAELQEKFPEAIGVNNHRGSKATSDNQTMLRFMNAYASTGWGFLDSHTIAKTIANKVAADYDIPVVQNCVFIDAKSDLATMKKKLYDALRTAEERGSAVAICHAREAILPFLKYLSKNEFGSVTFVTVDELWGDTKSAYSASLYQKANNPGGKK